MVTPAHPEARVTEVPPGRTAHEQGEGASAAASDDGGALKQEPAHIQVSDPSEFWLLVCFYKEVVSKSILFSGRKQQIIHGQNWNRIRPARARQFVVPNTPKNTLCDAENISVFSLRLHAPSRRHAIILSVKYTV